MTAKAPCRPRPRLSQAALVAVLVSVVLFWAASGWAADLIELIPGLYPGGIFLATDPTANHAAHFTIGAAASINLLNEQIAAATGVFPFSSSVGGFTFAFDPELDTFVRTTETLGPLFTERAPTLGKGRLNLHTSYTFFKYSSFGNERLSKLEVAARHEPDVIGFPDVREQFENDLVVIKFDIDINVQVLTLAATYGLTDRLDIGFVLPVAKVDMKVKARARVVESPENTLFPGVHTFTGAPTNPDQQASDSATGVGDVVLRAKYWALKGEPFDVAAAGLLQLPTGDDRNFIGTGTTAVRPFVVLSRTLFGRLTPHLNTGFEFNFNDSERHSFEYAAGFDIGVKNVSFAADVIGSHKLEKVAIGQDIVNASVGLKWNPWKQLLLLGNVQVPLNRQGLRSDVITTLGVEYTF